MESPEMAIRTTQPPTLGGCHGESGPLSTASEIIDVGSVDILVNNAGLLGFGSTSPHILGSDQ